MCWAPVAIRHEAGIVAWQPSWVCMSCAETVSIDDLPIPAEAGSHCRGCGDVLAWEFDRATASGHLACPRGCSPPAVPASAPRSPEPTDAPPCAGTSHAMPPVGAATTSPGAHGRVHVTGPARDAPAAHPRYRRGSATDPHIRRPSRWESRGEWYGCGPPAQVRSPTNSWLYVPLLHAALGALTDGALAQWRADPRAAMVGRGPSCPCCLGPCPGGRLNGGAHRSIHNHEALPETALAEAATLPPSTLIHLGWVVRHLVGEDGYITLRVRRCAWKRLAAPDLQQRLTVDRTFSDARAA